jgi:predicted Zn-dependent protease
MRPAARYARFLPMVLLALAAQSGCARNPVTGQLQLALISESQEIQMGQEGAAEVEAVLGLVPDAELQRWLQTLGTSMARETERPRLPWRFGVVDDPTPNAFALPGGFIYFTRGLLALMNSEAELASVLGHEIAHVTARHQVTMISRAQVAQAGLGLGGVLFPELEGLGGLAGAGLSLLFLRYSRDMERQADELGFGYSLQQGYDVREMERVFASLARLGDEQQSAVPTWLQTHPLPADRIVAVQARIAALEPLPAGLRVAREDYLSRIDGLVYGVNPRNGIFRDGWFMHPDLAFQLAIPGTWARQNLARAVMAVSPRQDAAIQLVLRPESTPDDAARAFLAQQGVQTIQTGRQTINGLPAVLASFRAQTSQAALQGLVGFIAYQGRVYQVLGYSAAAVYGEYQGVFQQSIGSFGPLRDPAILALQPSRLRMVRVGDSLTLAEFNRRFPSTIPVGELAVINAVAGPDSVLPAGTLVKRVATD